jgi:hypothetical protein
MKSSENILSTMIAGIRKAFFLDKKRKDVKFKKVKT